MVVTLGDDALALSTVKEWAAEFSKETLEDGLPQSPLKKALPAFIKW